MRGGVLPTERERSRGVAVKPTKEWNGAVVRTWLESRVVAARNDQVVAERGGRELQDDCDKASAEEMVCSLLKVRNTVDLQASFSAALLLLLERDEYIWRGVYNDTRFDRHVRSYANKLLKMAKTNEGFENTTHYQ
jgi:hypothetical protein